MPAMQVHALLAGFLVVLGAGRASLSAAPPGRIVGGVPIDITQAPYQVALLKWGLLTCGGSILSTRLVLTAAHCTDNVRSLPLLLSVRAGSSLSSGGGQVRLVAAIIQDPRYDARTVDYDVAVLKVLGAFTLGPSVQPVTLAAEGERQAVGTLATVSGWGTLSSDGPLPAQLQAVQVLAVSETECQEDYGALAITPRMVCYGVKEGGKDSCQGDSGGPLVLQHDGKAVQVGIVSWGAECAVAGYPGVYTDLSNKDIRQLVDSAR